MMDDHERLVGAVVVTSDGVRRGPVRDVLTDNHTGLAEWVSVGSDARASGECSGGIGATARSGGVETVVVPLAGASLAGRVLSVDVSDAAIRAVPDAGRRAVGSEVGLTPEQETLLYRHYRLSPAGDTDVDPASGSTQRSRQAGVDHSLLPGSQR